MSYWALSAGLPALDQAFAPGLLIPTLTRENGAACDHWTVEVADGAATVTTLRRSGAELDAMFDHLGLDPRTVLTLAWLRYQRSLGRPWSALTGRAVA